MEKQRRIQFIGDAYYISLPPDWVKQHKLKQGDILVIRPTTKPVVRVKIPSPLVELKPSERKRKLQFIGDTYYIALLPEWIKHWNLKKGDKLVVEYSDKPIVRVKIPKSLAP